VRVADLSKEFFLDYGELRPRVQVLYHLRRDRLVREDVLDEFKRDLRLEVASGMLNVAFRSLCQMP
jgi:hypothetical protein